MILLEGSPVLVETLVGIRPGVIIKEAGKGYEIELESGRVGWYRKDLITYREGCGDAQRENP